MLQDTCNTTTTGGPNCTVSTYFRVSQQEVSQNPDYTSILTVRHCKIHVNGSLVCVLVPASESAVTVMASTRC